jgi:FKBP-type peptidyl-prolyl cis-trans isomerase SlyD
MQVADKMMVSIRYKMKNDKGEVLENTMEGAPVTYLHGVGSIYPGLEAKLHELKVGDAKTFWISDEQTETGVGKGYLMEVVVDEIRFPTEEELKYGFPRQEDEDSCGPACCC